MTPTISDILRADAAGRIVLPAEFANATLQVVRVGEDEIVLRRANDPTQQPDALPRPTPQPEDLSAADWELVVDLVENPPPPNEALRKLMAGEYDPSWGDPN